MDRWKHHHSAGLVQGAGVFVRLVFQMAYEIRYFMLLWTVVFIGFANAYVMLLPASIPSFLNMGVALSSTFTNQRRHVGLTRRG